MPDLREPAPVDPAEVAPPPDLTQADEPIKIAQPGAATEDEPRRPGVGEKGGESTFTAALRKGAGRVQAQARAHLAALRRVRVAVARRDVNAFAEYVMRDEEHGGAILQAWPHREWHRLAERWPRLMLWSHVESGKTFGLAVVRTLWELGCDPTLRFAVFSDTHGQATKISRIVMRYIEESDRLHEVFPNLLPGDPWTASAFTVKRKTFSKDPSVQAAGIGGTVLGARVDRLLLDDVLDYENTRTPERRQATTDWYNSAGVIGRLTARGRVIWIGNAWHPQDAMHVVGAQWNASGQGHAARFAVVDDDPASPTFGQPRWPEHWNAERIAKKKAESTPLEFARQMLCVARDDDTARFKREFVERALARGREPGRRLLPMGYPNGRPPPGIRTYTGVDLGVQQNIGADLSSLFTIAVEPDGTRMLLDLETGRWPGPEIVARIQGAHRRFGSIVWVEGNAAQDFIVQFSRGASSVPVRSFVTGRNKHNLDFGVESIAVELANGKWAIPNVAGAPLPPDVEALIEEMLTYDPRGHTGDRLVSMWIAREAARAGAVGVESVRVSTLRR